MIPAAVPMLGAPVAPAPLGPDDTFPDDAPRPFADPLAPRAPPTA